MRLLPYPWLFILGIAAARMLRGLLADGMFLDGLIYASLARNLAEGYGSFWAPRLSETMFPVFAEHPPLFFGVESLAFAALGDHPYVEKLVSLGLGVVAAFLVTGCWQGLLPSRRQLTWLPVILVLASPMMTWVFAYNMLETQLIAVSLAALWFALRTPGAGSGSFGLIAYPVAVGLCVFAAVLIKGPVGLFPLAAYGCLWMSGLRQGFWRAVWSTALVVATLCVGFAVLWQFEGARAAIHRYLDAQLLPSLSGDRGVDPVRFRALGAYWDAIGIPVLVTAALLAVLRRFKAPEPERDDMRVVLAMLLMGLGSSVPLFVSPRMHTFYLAPSVPFFALSAAALLARPVLASLPPAGTRGAAMLTRIGWVVFVGGVALGVCSSFKVSRDQEVVAAARSIIDAMPEQGRAERVIAGCDRLREDWGIQAYLQRYGRISVAFDGRPARFKLLGPGCDDQAGEIVSDASQAYRLVRLPGT